jgi:hypothetical protein
MKADGQLTREQDRHMPPACEPAHRPPGARWRAGFSTAVLWAAIGMGLAGCTSEPTRYKLVPPTTPSGEACVAKCDEQRKECNASLQNQFEVCQTQYREDMGIYTRCRNSSLGPAPGSQFSCNIPRACQLPSGESCEETYRACFEACGGKVEQEAVP